MRARYLPRGGVACGFVGSASAWGASTKENLTQKELGRLLPSPLSREIRGGLAGVVFCEAVRAVGEQQPHHLNAAFHGRSVESREAEVLTGMDVGAVGKQLPHDLDVSPRASGVDGSDLRRVTRSLVGVGTV